MPLLIALLAASVLAGWAAWARGLQAVAAGAAVAVFVLLFLLGRRIEAQRDTDWASAAGALHATFRDNAGELCAAFGQPAPWDEWARHGQLQCPRAIDGRGTQPPFAILQVRYSVRESRGEEHPDSWYDVSVAVLPLARKAPAGTLQPRAAPPGYAEAANGEALFVWKQASRGAGAALPASELPQLLEAARGVAPPRQ